MCLCVSCEGIRYVPDTDNEYYDKEGSEDSDASEDSGASTKDEKPTVSSASQSMSTQSQSTKPQLKRRLSDTADDDHTDNAARSSTRRQDSSAVDGVSTDTVAIKESPGDKRQSSDHEAVSKKRLKTDCEASESKSNVNSHGMTCSDLSDDHFKHQL